MKEMNKSDNLLSISQAAERLGVSESTVRRMIDDKEIIAYKIRGQWRIRESAITEYLERNSNQ